MRRRRHRTFADLLGLHSPLGRYGFATCTVGAAVAEMPGTFTVCLLITIYAWKK